jgi:hypothetical protein
MFALIWCPNEKLNHMNHRAILLTALPLAASFCFAADIARIDAVYLVAQADTGTAAKGIRL